MMKKLALTIGIALTALLIFTEMATAAPTVCIIPNGCTGTSTLPAFGKVLVGNAAGTGYDYVATSTFGGVSSVTGTTNQITASPSTGAVILSIPSLFSISLASTTGLSALGNLYAGSGTATTTIRGGATSTFIGGITISSSDATSTFDKGLSAFAINLTGTATSTGANGFDLTAGCWSINGTCLQTIISSASAYKQAVKYASTSTLPTYTYSNGSSGVGATITGTALQPLFIDGNTAALGDRVLIKNETAGNAPNNGIYTVTTAGVGGLTAFVLTRATDYNSSLDVFPGVASFTNSGTVNANTCWILTNTTAVTIGTTALTYDDACGAGSFSATWPITLSGTTIGFNGLSTSSAIAAGAAVLYATGVNTIASVATSTPVIGSVLSYTGTLGNFVGGTGGTFGIANNAVTYAMMQQVAAGKLLGNVTGATANVAEISTSTLFGSPTAGFVLAFNGGQWVGVATTVASCSAGITCSFSGGTNSFSIGTNALALSQLPQISANRFWGNPTGATANATEVASTSFFAGLVGQVPSFVGTGNMIGTSSLVIDTTQNVGVGSSTPWGKLSVDTTGMTALTPQFAIGSSTNTNFIISNNGYLGVGTTSPYAVASFVFGSSTPLAAAKFVIASTSNVAGSWTELFSMNNIGSTTFRQFKSNGVAYNDSNNTLVTTGQGGANTVLTANSGAPTWQSTFTIAGTVTISTAIVTPIIGNTGAAAGVTIKSTNSAGTGDFIKCAVHNNGNKPSCYGSTDGNWSFGAFASTTPWALLSLATSSTSSAPFIAVGYSSANGLSGATSTPFIVDQNGRTGIGSSTPWGELSVNASSTIFAPAGPIFVVGSSTLADALFIVDQTQGVGIGTSSPAYAASVQISSSTPLARAKFVIASTSNNGATTEILIASTIAGGTVTVINASTTALTIGTNLVPGFVYPSLSYSTSTWTGTTTLQLGIASIREKFISVQCVTDVGTLNVQFYDGTNKLDMFNASTTKGVVTFVTNNTFAVSDSRSVDFGTPASSPTYASCTVKKTYIP